MAADRVAVARKAAEVLAPEALQRDRGYQSARDTPVEPPQLQAWEEDILCPSLLEMSLQADFKVASTGHCIRRPPLWLDVSGGMESL